MSGTEIEKRFDNLDQKLSPEEYNFAHFRTKHLVNDIQATFQQRGIQPGDAAPDFELPRVGRNNFRLSELRGKPVLLHFGSYT